MNISTKGRYAVQLMMDIAINQKSGPVCLKNSAMRQDISFKYLEQIMAMLVKAEYVKSIRGPQGGYLLNGQAKDFTVGMILKTVEGDMSPVACVSEGVVDCSKSGECVSVRIWQELDAAINGVLNKYTIQDLVDWQAEQGLEYC